MANAWEKYLFARYKLYELLNNQKLLLRKGIDADHISFTLYKGGIYNEPKCDPDHLTHAILVVGRTKFILV